MKGTIDRGKDIFEDRKRIRELKYSIKNRAENIMIVDMIRNDLGRICSNGSVKTSKIFEVEKYNTLFQLVTTVCGKLFPETSYYDIFKSIFPGGSITGAPKIRTMEIIRMLEKNKRRIYCGALGIIFPGKKRAVFNIPIRTVQLERSCGEMGIGGGIVWDSSPKSEYQEALLKSKFLTVKPEEFCLLETILWKNKYFLLAGHLSRLKASAEYFSFPLALDKIEKKLKEKENKFEKHLAYKIRLLVSKTGAVNLEAAVIQKENTAEKILISSIRVNSKDRYLYHKTTKRSLYDTERGRYVKGDILDVLFLNENNEITEGAISNIFIAKKGRYYTPPVSSGLLPGVYRSYYIKKKAALEKPLFLDDLKTADKIILTNSVRGASRVTLV
jgi:para-aminobenzoate synthetase/4-amino-4-deoxychorismate lyase